MGVLSLAVRPETIAAVQSTPIPIDGLTVSVNPDLFQPEADALRAATSELVEAEAEAAAASIHPRERRMMQFGIRFDRGGLAKRVGDRQLRFYDSWHRLEERLGEYCLPNASAVVRRDFNDAMAHWRSENPAGEVGDFVERYRSMGALLERSADVIAAVARQPWRAV